MRRVPLVIVPLALALAGGPDAGVAHTPPVPAFVQGLVAQRAGDLAYTPTRVPLYYRYRSYKVAAGTRRVTYVFARVPPAAGQPPFTVTISRYRGRLAACGDGRLQTLQLAGNRVFWDGTTAWRCVRHPGGGAARVSVTGDADPARFAAKLAYGRVAASIRRIT